jgi:hypothetical protein
MSGKYPLSFYLTIYKATHSVRKLQSPVFIKYFLDYKLDVAVALLAHICNFYERA